MKALSACQPWASKIARGEKKTKEEKKVQIIYEPRGKAREYCELAANLYRGCSHGCVYCYAPAATFKSREVFVNPVPRDNVLEKLEKDVASLKRKESRPVLLSFTSDAYQPCEQRLELTRSALKIMKPAGLSLKILTKGGRLVERDFDLLDQKEDWIGATMTFLNGETKKYEPGAASPDERIAMLKNAKAAGFQTWVSLEPVIDAEQTKEIVRRTHQFVDLFKVGKLNYMASEIDWKKFGHEIVDLFESLNCKYYVKDDLRKLL
jgi:DNA repair photolyase